MKISFKTVMKGLVAAGTAVGAGILALQTKKSADADAEQYDATLAPIGEAPATEEAKTEMDTIDVPTAEAEVVNDEETETKEE